jgi:hypothetical protein
MLIIGHCYIYIIYLMQTHNETIILNPGTTQEDKSAKCLTKHHNQKTHKNSMLQAILVGNIAVVSELISFVSL